MGINQMDTKELESDVFVQVAWELGDKIFRKHKRNILKRRFYLFSDWAILNSYLIQYPVLRQCGKCKIATP